MRRSHAIIGDFRGLLWLYSLMQLISLILLSAIFISNWCYQGSHIIMKWEVFIDYKFDVIHKIKKS
jgi:hypothetical protein